MSISKPINKNNIHPIFLSISILAPKYRDGTQSNTNLLRSHTYSNMTCMLILLHKGEGSTSVVKGKVVPVLNELSTTP
jgi:hypothetical protein